MRFRSLKLRLALVARALTMPRRMRSWIRRSSSGSSRAGAGMCSRAGSRAGDAVRAGLRRCASALATMPPGDEESKDDVQAAEAGGEKIVCPGGGREGGEGAGGHETQAHDGNDRDGVGAAGDDA